MRLQPFLKMLAGGGMIASFMHASRTFVQPESLPPMPIVIRPTSGPSFGS